MQRTIEKPQEQAPVAHPPIVSSPIVPARSNPYALYPPCPQGCTWYGFDGMRWGMIRVPAYCHCTAGHHYCASCMQPEAYLVTGNYCPVCARLKRKTSQSA